MITAERPEDYMTESASPPTPMSTLNTPAYVVAGMASIAVIVGSLGPWGILQNPLASATFSGTDGSDGKLTLIAAGIAGTGLLVRASWNSSVPLTMALLAGALCALVGFTDLFRGNAMFAETGDVFASIGWGLWLVCIGSVALLLGLILCLLPQIAEAFGSSAHTTQVRGPAVQETSMRKTEVATTRPTWYGRIKASDRWGYVIVAMCCLATVTLHIWAFSVRTPWG